MDFEDIIAIIFSFGILLLIASGLGFAFGFIGFLPFKLSDQIELNTEITSSNTTQLNNIPPNTYRLNCQVKIYGYRYDLFGGIINHTGGLHGPNYTNITLLINQNVLFSESIIDTSDDSRFSSQLKLNETVNITVIIDFTLKDVPENKDFDFNATWTFIIEEEDIFKELTEAFYVYKEIALFWGFILILGSYIASKLDL